MDLLGHYNHWVAVGLMMLGLWITIESRNLIKKLIGVGVLQTSVFVLYLSFGRVEDGAAPILVDGQDRYSNPLPQVLILTAIVVGVATLSLGLALAMRIGASFGTIEDDLLEDGPGGDEEPSRGDADAEADGDAGWDADAGAGPGVDEATAGEARRDATPIREATTGKGGERP